MKRAAGLAVVAAALFAGVLLFERAVPDRPPPEARLDADSMWYHASDVARLASTGRPQLVEFFHPD